MSFSVPVTSPAGYCVRMSVVMCSIAACTAIAAAAGPEYDIPLSELTKVRKDSPPKPVKSETRKKKTVAPKPQATAAEAAADTPAAPAQTASDASANPTVSKTPAAASPVEPAAKTKASTPEPKIPVEREPPSPTTATAPVPASGPVRIHHDPYSFVVAGKRTVIQAVISSDADIQGATCRVLLPEGAGQLLLKMEKVAGSRFTYTATLPGRAAEGPSLRYTIIAVDSLGRGSVSPEFVTPVTVSTAVPGWQIEGLGEAVQDGPSEVKKHQEGITPPAATR